jgi:hypothetical protein
MGIGFFGIDLVEGIAKQLLGQFTGKYLVIEGELGGTVRERIREGLGVDRHQAILVGGC